MLHSGSVGILFVLGWDLNQQSSDHKAVHFNPVASHPLNQGCVVSTTPGLGHQSVSGETNISAFLHRCSNIYTSTWIQTVRSDGGTQFKHDSRKTNLQTCCLRSSNEDYVSRSVFARPSVQSRPSSLGFCPGGGGRGGMAQLPLQSAGPLLPSTLGPITHQLLRQCHPAANRGRDPGCLSERAVFDSLRRLHCCNSFCLGTSRLTLTHIF